MQTDPLLTVAFNQAVAEHTEGLMTFATRLLHDHEQAEDVVQDAFLALYRHLSQVPASAFRPWLYRVTRNLCLDILRRRKFKLRLFRDVSRHDDYEPVPVDTGEGRPDEVAEAREVEQAMEQAIQDLPLKFREAFLLCELEGLSYEDAAAVLGCPVKTVSTRLFRARQRFRAALERLIKV
jgi:RNA polymerase sigma-70 factor (ECF subfamily)